MEYLHELFGRLFSSLPLINAIIYLYQDGLMDVYLLDIALKSNTTLFLLLELSQLWPSGVLSVGYSIPFTCPHNFFNSLSIYLYIFLSTPLFLVLQVAPLSSCIFPAPDLESGTSSRSQASFIGGQYILAASPLSDMCLTHIFSLSVVCLFISKQWPSQNRSI